MDCSPPDKPDSRGGLQRIVARGGRRNRAPVVPVEEGRRGPERRGELHRGSDHIVDD